MKRLAVCLLVLSFGAVFVPGLSNGSAGGPFDSVTGSGWRGTVAQPTTPSSHFAVSAHDGAQGVSGIYSSQSPNLLLDFRGDVTCLYVNGDHAIVGGVETTGANAGTGFAVGFVDNPSPTPDLVTFSDVTIGTPVDCVAEAVLFTLPMFTVLRGNVEIDDAP
jgi:hypothetical protein